jgi:hypothetical protein
LTGLDQREIERRWCVYARRVLEQRAGCPCDTDDAAWPGFIGENYSVGRVLIVGSIHNAPVLRASGIYNVLPYAKRWVAADAGDDSRYLRVVRAAYADAIPHWIRYVNDNGRYVAGAVWTNIAKVVGSLGLTLSDIAFTNLAKCGLPTKTSWRLERLRIEAHEQHTPLSRLIRDIEPQYVLIAKEVSGITEIVRLEPRELTLVRWCHNLNFTSAGRKRDVWLAEDVEWYAGIGRL